MNTITKKAANSIVGKLTAGILAVASALLGATAPLAPVAGAQDTGSGVLVVGDSLEVGSAPYLRQALPGVPLEIDARNGRTSGQGVAVLADKLRPEHGTIVFPLGTNDTSAAALGASLATLRELAGGRCIVLATITRPPLGGAPAAALDRVIEQVAGQGRVQVADWRTAALSSDGVLGSDRVHPTGLGRAIRAGLLAEAVEACLSGADLGGIPAPRDPHARPPPREREPAGPPARPLTLPAPAAFAALATGLERVARLVSAAAHHAQTAASAAEPEPVLGVRPDPSD